ncbi:hypothetical protein Tco_0783897 [Tanacetum coccineum]
MLDYRFNFMNTKIYIDNESTICIVRNPVFHSKTKHIEIRHHFIIDSYEKKLIQVIKIHTDHNVADLLTEAFDVSRCQDTILGGAEAQIRFEAASKQSNDPPLSRVNTLFWATAKAKIVNGERQIQALVYKKKVIITEKSVRRDLMLDDAEGTECLPNDGLIFQGEGSTVPKRLLPCPMIHSPKCSLLLGSDLRGSITRHELRSLLSYTLSKKVFRELGTDLKQTKLTYGAAYTKLIMKVKKLENRIKSSKARRRVRLIVSKDEGDLEDPSKQGRKIAQLDEDEGITLVQMGAQTQGRHEHDLESDFDFTAPEEVYTAELDISNVNVPVSTVGAEVSTVSLEVKIAAESLVYIRRSAAKRKDKGNAFMKEAGTCSEETKNRYFYHEGSKRQKTNEEQSAEEEKELSEEELQKLMMIVPVEEVYVEALQVKYPIIDWEKFDRDDLDKLWSLVKERFSSINPTDDKERTLWIELKRLFEPDIDDILLDMISFLVGEILPVVVTRTGYLTLMLCNKLQVDQYSEMANELLKKIFILANRPRQ